MPKDRQISKEDILMINEMIKKSRIAMAEIENYSQEQLDQLCQSIGWHTSNQENFTINISPKNIKYQNIINNIGGKIIQKTFIFKKK